MIVFSTIIKIAALISYILLALFTLRSSAAANIRRLFFIYLFGMIYWQFTSLMVNFSKNPQTALFWYNLLVSGSGLYSILFFPFTRAFLGIKGQKKLTYFAYLACIVIVILGLAGLVFKDVYMGQAGIYVPKINSAIVYILGVVGYFFWGYSVFNLIRGLTREKSPFQRNRIKYPLLGASLVIFGTASNFTPLQDFPIDMTCNLINAALIGYAVIRYRLLDIRVILTRSLSYSLLTGSVVGIYTVSILVSEGVLKSFFGYTSSLSGIVAILILAFVFLPLRNGIQKGVDRMFFREKQDYQRVLESFSRAVTSVLDLEELLNLILTTVTKTIKVNKAFIALFNEERGEYITERFYMEHDAIPRVTFKRDNLLARWLEREGLPLLGEEMKMDPKFETLLEESREIFEKMGISLVVPILLKGRLTGTINLGEKLSREIYNYEDMRFLTTIANQTATAIDNASAYKEIGRRLSEQTLLFILGETFRKPIGFDKIMYSVVEILMNFLNIDYCLIIYFEEDNFKTYSHGLSEILIEKIKAKCANVANDPAARIRDESFLFLDIGSRFKGESGLSDKERKKLESSIYLLFKQSDEVLGVLVTPKRGAVDQKETDLFRSIRAIVSPGIMLHRTIVNLVEMKSYNESILNSMNSGVVVIDTDKRITTINREAERMTGLRSEDVVGHHIYEAEVLHQLSPVVSETMNTGEPIVNREVSIRLADGRRIPLGVSTSILIDAENRTKGVVSIFMDLSQIKQLESQLIRSEKLASVGQLAAGVSHELRNPLGSIFGYAELLNERISSDDEVVKRGLRTILAESERSQHIIESLLDYARMREPSLVTTDLNKVVENTLPLIKHQLSQENVVLEVFLEENLPSVEADEEQMKQVFINLILNAQQAMAGGGRLTISTYHADGWIKASFQDTGCGIPEENMGKLFDPFFTTKEYGTGLGLPTVHRIVENHHGLIEVESKIEVGSKFTISLMASPEGARSMAEPPHRPALQT